MDSHPSLSHIGRRLQRLRREQGLTLAHLAGDSGLSPGYLSQIEAGSAVPSLRALQSVAAGLGADVADFFPDQRRRGTRVIRAAERRAFRIEPEPGEEYAVLAGQVHDRAFSALYTRHVPGPGGGERPFRHRGEEFCLVLSGTLQLTIDGDSHQLGPGDWLHYPSHPSHSAHVISENPVEALWLLAPAVM
jgi:transcriptional regulator with XRE-family HTH domain